MKYFIYLLNKTFLLEVTFEKLKLFDLGYYKKSILELYNCEHTLKFCLILSIFRFLFILLKLRGQRVT